MPVTIEYGPTQQLTMFTAFGSGPGVGGGIDVSPFVDNGTDRYDDYLVLIRMNTNGSSGDWNFYFNQTEGNSSQTDYFNSSFYVLGSDSGNNINLSPSGYVAVTSEAGTTEFGNVRVLGNPRFGSGVTVYGPTSIANKFGGVMPQKFGIIHNYIRYFISNGSNASIAPPVIDIFYQGIKFTN